MSQRRRTPPPPRAICFRCGWKGTPPYAHLPDEFGDVALTLSAKHCPACGSSPVSTLEPPPPVPIQIIRAVREAKLTENELRELADGLSDIPADSSPREVASRFPRAAKIVGPASKLGKDWIPTLSLILGIVMLHMSVQAHHDSERSHHDAVQSHQDAEKAAENADRAHQDAERAHDDATSNTGALSEKDVTKIAEQIEKLSQDRR